MKIAIIVPYPIVPADEGGRVRAVNLVRQLATRHDVMLVTPRSKAYADHDLPALVAQTTAAGRLRQILDAGSIAGATWRAMRLFGPDVIVSEYPWPGLRAWLIARRLGVPLVLDAPNVEGDRFRSTGSRVSRVVDIYERFVARRASAVFTVSEDDASRFRARGVRPDKIQLVPNGVNPQQHHRDAEAGARVRRKLGIPETTAILLFFGQLGYPPNHDALRVIHHELLPRLDRNNVDYTFVVCGKNHEQAAQAWTHPRLRYLGPVDEIAPYINAADVVTVPVTSGGGTRLKILESIACGTPVVATTPGAEGVDTAVCGGLLTVIDGWDSFADALPHGRTVKPGNVPAGFLDMYSWAGIVSRIEWPT